MVSGGIKLAELLEIASYRDGSKPAVSLEGKSLMVDISRGVNEKPLKIEGLQYLLTCLAETNSEIEIPRDVSIESEITAFSQRNLSRNNYDISVTETIGISRFCQLHIHYYGEKLSSVGYFANIGLSFDFTSLQKAMPKLAELHAANRMQDERAALEKDWKSSFGRQSFITNVSDRNFAINRFIVLEFLKLQLSRTEPNNPWEVQFNSGYINVGGPYFKCTPRGRWDKKEGFTPYLRQFLDMLQDVFGSGCSARYVNSTDGDGQYIEFFGVPKDMAVTIREKFPDDFTALSMQAPKPVILTSSR